MTGWCGAVHAYLRGHGRRGYAVTVGTEGTEVTESVDLECRSTRLGSPVERWDDCVYVREQFSQHQMRVDRARAESRVRQVAARGVPTLDAVLANVRAPYQEWVEYLREEDRKEAALRGEDPREA